MKIGIDARTLVDAQYSGIPEYTHNLLREILMLDKKNQYILFLNSARDISDSIPVFCENIEKVYTRYPNKIFNYIMQMGFGKPQIDELLGVDLFFMPHINFASLTKKTKKIITIHDLSFVRYSEFFSYQKIIWHWLINVKKLLTQFDLIVAVSENTKRDLIQLMNINPDKIKVIYSGIEASFAPVSRKQNLEIVKRKYNLPDKFIFFLGTIEPRKNIESIILSYDNLLEEYSELREYDLILAGSRGWKQGVLRKTWQNSKNEKKIKFLGNIDGEDRVYLYNLAKIFVYPSFYEGFGFPPLEAMACGIPTIVSNSSSLTEVGGDAVISIDPYNTNDLKIAMKELLLNSDLYTHLKNTSLKQAQQFNWELSAKKYLEVFNSITK